MAGNLNKRPSLFPDTEELFKHQNSNTPVTMASMHNPQLRLLNALRGGSKPIMTFLGLPSFRTAQIVAQTGVDVSMNLP